MFLCVCRVAGFFLFVCLVLFFLCVYVLFCLLVFLFGGVLFVWVFLVHAVDFLCWLSTSMALKCCWPIPRSKIMSCSGIHVHTLKVHLLKSAVLIRRGFSSSVHLALEQRNGAFCPCLGCVSTFHLIPRQYSSEGGREGVHRSQHCAGRILMLHLPSLACTVWLVWPSTWVPHLGN